MNLPGYYTLGRLYSEACGNFYLVSKFYAGQGLPLNQQDYSGSISKCRRAALPLAVRHSRGKDPVTDKKRVN